MSTAAQTNDPTPRHGDRGTAATSDARFPRSLTIAVSRQSGARGGSIAKRVGRVLGWQTFDQEVMEYLAQQGDPGVELPPGASDWIDRRLGELQSSGRIPAESGSIQFARLILAIGATGEAVLVGRGAGFLLPSANTLHVRIVAPRVDRVAYWSQWQRLTPAEAEQEVIARDNRRQQYMLDQFSVDAADPVNYDLVLNSSLLGVETCADLIVQTARAKLLTGKPK
jgi:hypothetical protein